MDAALVIQPGLGGVKFPQIERIDVRSYGLFPGRERGGLAINLRPGLTLVVGANGLGKSTLVLMVYRSGWHWQHAPGHSAATATSPPPIS